MSETPEDMFDHLSIAAAVVSAYVRKNSVPMASLPEVIKEVFKTLCALDATQNVDETPKPPVPVKRSVTSDYLICLEDGKRVKMLKRYLRTHHGLSFAEYRTKWRLPPNYPSIAPEYAARRSALAKASGLGGTHDSERHAQRGRKTSRSSRGRRS